MTIRPMMARLLVLLVLLNVWAEPVTATMQQAIDAYEAHNYEQALGLWRDLAEAGNAEAQYSLGVMYHKGQGTPQDESRAVHWFRQAAEQNHLDSMFNLGIAYWEGKGVEQDSQQAVSWWRRAAELGLPEAQHNLGTVYYLGQGVAQDYALAVAWFRRAADNGHKEAERILLLLSDKYPDLVPTVPTQRQAELAPAATTATQTAARPGPAGASESAPDSPAPASALQVYAYPAKSAPVITELPAAAEPVVLARAGDWFQIKLPDALEVWAYGIYIDGDSGPGVVNTEGVRARPLPNTTARSRPLGLFPAGQVVEVLRSEGEWKRVKVTGLFPGWVPAAATPGVTVKQPAPAAAPATVPTSDLLTPTRVYAYASPTAPVIAEFNQDSDIEVLDRQGDWLQVAVPGGVLVWVYGAYVDGDSGPASINTTGVRARSLPNTSKRSRPVGMFHNGEPVEVVEQVDDWKRVRVVGRFPGWVRTGHSAGAWRQY